MSDYLWLFWFLIIPVAIIFGLSLGKYHNYMAYSKVILISNESSVTVFLGSREIKSKCRLWFLFLPLDLEVAKGFIETTGGKWIRWHYSVKSLTLVGTDVTNETLEERLDNERQKRKISTD